MTLNVSDDLTTWYMRDFPNWLNSLGHARVKASAGATVEDAAYVVALKRHRRQGHTHRLAGILAGQRREAPPADPPHARRRLHGPARP